ncbi:MAG: L,D-transpeptidase [Alphaproteobacteria bacterium]|nr:L,D-transpeptidase [Alphaproteobacteria bacterium]
MPAARHYHGMKTEPYHISVFVPVDRLLPGFMRVFDPDGVRVLYDLPCRTKADGADAAEHDNPHRDPTRPYGDTPTGLYRPTWISRYIARHRTFGHHAILLEGQTGDALKAAQNGRTGLAIHGGRGDDKLMATYGCIRMFDRDIAMLAEEVGQAAVVVEVIESGPWPPIFAKGE